MATSLSRASGQADSGRASLNAPLFRSLMERLHDGKRWVVLDFGRARTETVAVFSPFRCRLDIADLTEGLEALNAEEDARRLRQTAEALLPPLRDEQTDLVLCWDFLNYLRRPALTALMERVAARCRPGTVAHALVVYSAARMPATPGGYVPLADYSLAELAKSPEMRDAPRYTPEDLANCLHAFTVDRGRLLRNGMQEFLFRL